MRSISKLALVSVICGGVAVTLSCLMILSTFLFPYGSIAAYEFARARRGNPWLDLAMNLGVPLSLVGALVTFAVGQMVLKRPTVDSRERRRQTQARIGVYLGVLSLLVYLVGWLAYALSGVDQGS